MEPGVFVDAVGRTAERFGMDLSRPLAMVSGGPDSVAMLRAIVEMGARPVVLHVEHRLRGEESREDARFVRGLCEELGLLYEERRAELGRSNLQEEARKERYRYAEEVADDKGLSTVVTGHTADDVAETVLMNLARGAGLRGLSGIPPVRGRFARPLIKHRRAEILAYLERLGQPYRTDSTNLEPKYARNRIRLEVLPVLEELYPGAAANVARTAALVREDLGALEELAAGAVHGRGEEVVVPLRSLCALPAALQRHAIRKAYQELLPGVHPLDSAHVEAVLRATETNDGTTTLDLPGGVVAAIRPGEVAFYRDKVVFGGETGLGVGTLEFVGWIVDAREVVRFDARDASRPEVAYLDASRGPYRVRMAREGDTIRPLGLGGTKKVFRAMMDRKAPKDLRRRTPVIVDPTGKVAWVFLGELSEEFRVDEATEQVLRLEVRKAHGDE